MLNRRIYKIGGVLLLIIAVIGFRFYFKIFGSAVKNDAKIYIHSNYTLEELKNTIQPHIKNLDNFTFVADKKKFTKPKAGMYVLEKGMSMNDVVNLFRSGNQTPVKVSFNNQDTVEKLAGRIAQQLETDSISLLNAFMDSKFLAENNLTKQSALQVYIPNSYEFYWNISAEKFRDKMLKEFKKFWNQKRLEKAKKINLTKDEVITLASIVQKETAQKSERPIVAGLYLNRLKKNWPLQADPTIIYAIKQIRGQDYVVKRVLTKDLEINSPYNTYKKIGLPPTLIAMPDATAIDAVLNPAKHDYMFMCASVENIGYHEFAKTLAQHNRYAAKYQRWIDRQGINR